MASACPDPTTSLVNFPVDAIKVGDRCRHDLRDLKSLAASIETLGLLHPVVVTRAGLLIAGLRRLEVLKLLGHTTIAARVLLLDDDAALDAEVDENIARADFLPSEKVAIAMRYRELEEKAARLRRGHRSDLRGKLTPGEGGKTRDRLARRVGWSGNTLQHAMAVVEAARADPANQDLVEYMDTTGKVEGAYQKLQTRQRLADIDQEQHPLPRGKYRTIVADPPWDVPHAAAQYPTMSTEEICALGHKVKKATADDGAHLYLWAINEKLPDAFRVMEAWGFRYITKLTWLKEGPDGRPTKQGQGQYYRGNTEDCLFGVRGRAPAASHQFMTGFLAPRRGAHSTKPDDVFFPMVEEVSPAPRLEMFGRRRRPGWDVWGFDAPRCRRPLTNLHLRRLRRIPGRPSTRRSRPTIPS